MQAGVLVSGLVRNEKRWSRICPTRYHSSMRLKTKWLLVSVAGSLLIAVVLFFSDTLFVAVADVPAPLGAVANAVLWPVAVCVHLSGPGPRTGTPQKPFHEWTPVQDFAVVIGIGLSWFFYSSFVFLLIWLRQKRRLRKRSSSKEHAGEA
jgi:hypothetical protein